MIQNHARFFSSVITRIFERKLTTVNFRDSQGKNVTLRKCVTIYKNMRKNGWLNFTEILRAVEIKLLELAQFALQNL